MKKYAKLNMDYAIESINLNKNDIVEIEEITIEYVYFKAYGYHLKISKYLFDVFFDIIHGEIDITKFDSLNKDLSCRHCNSCTCK